MDHSNVVLEHERVEVARRGSRGTQRDKGACEDCISSPGNDPGKHHKHARNKQLRLQQAKPKACPGEKWAVSFEVEKEDESQQNKHRHLTGKETDQCRSKGISEQSHPCSASTIHDPHKPDRHKETAR